MDEMTIGFLAFVRDWTTNQVQRPDDSKHTNLVASDYALHLAWVGWRAGYEQAEKSAHGMIDACALDGVITDDQAKALRGEEDGDA
jgi:hypothetical protein